MNMTELAHAYDPAFFDAIRDTSTPSAKVVVPIIMSLLQPGSVVDVGCGEGAWLSVFKHAGVERILGFDGYYVDTARLLIPQTCFRPLDLQATFAVDESFDLAICLEVGEHLPAASADGLVHTLTASAPVVLFSAAIPLQGGTNHLNEQWPTYWSDLFQKHSFDCFDVLRDPIWSDDRVQWWYRQNLLLFALHGSDAWTRLFRVAAPGTPLERVHPALWNHKCEMLGRTIDRLKTPGLRSSANNLLGAVARRLRFA